jgi:hypothetical protein
MKFRRWLGDPRTRLDIAAGLVDGILNALILAAGRMLKAAGPDPILVVRVATATGLTTIFVFFVAHYAELRAELAEAERELNLSQHGRLAASQLGRRALVSAAAGAALAAACGVVGAVGSLVICMALPSPRGAGLVTVIALLALLGALLARSFHGNKLAWAAVIAAGGAALTWIGVQLNIAG